MNQGKKAKKGKQWSEELSIKKEEQEGKNVKIECKRAKTMRISGSGKSAGRRVRVMERIQASEGTKEGDEGNK